MERNGCGDQGGGPHEKSLLFEGGPLTSIQTMQIVHYASKSILHFEVHDTLLLHLKEDLSLKEDFMPGGGII